LSGETPYLIGFGFEFFFNFEVWRERVDARFSPSFLLKYFLFLSLCSPP
jgi:hypothetical protein